MHKLFKGIIASGLILGLLSASSTFVSASGYDLPKEKFNPEFYSTEIPAGYYDSLDMNLQEDQFRENLETIISEGFRHHDYSYNSTVFLYADTDPNHPGNVIGFYSGRSLSGGYNREHVWAKSHGFPSKSAYPYSDAHHLRPTLTNINSSRGHKDFGELPEEAPDAYGNKTDSEIFEPRDEVKGDVARIMFYMATRYGVQSGYNLKLVADRTTSTSDSNGRFGGLNTLIKWHYEDPVSKEEIYRNNAIYYLFQNNRNPYIDHPEYVDNAYPSEYANVVVDEEKVLNVKNKIDLLPAVINITHKGQIREAEDLYYKLNYKERKLITNLDKLMDAIDALNALEKPVDPTPEPDKPNPDPNPDLPDVEGAQVIDFRNHNEPNFSYTNDKKLTIGDLEFTASSAGCYDKELRIGSNKDISIPKKLGGGSGVALEMNFNLNDINYFSFKTLNKYGSISGVYLYLSQDNGVTYKKLNYNLGSEGGSINLDTPISGRLALVFKGSKPRVVLDTIELNSIEKKPVEESFIGEKCQTSLKLKYNTNTLEMVDVAIRFGGLISKDSYNKNAKYGVLVLIPEEVGDLKPGLQDVSKISDIKSDRYKEITPLKYSATEYELKCEITGNLSLSRNLVGFIYMEYNGKLYLSNSIEASIRSTAQRYLDEDNVSSDCLEVLRKIIG